MEEKKNDILPQEEETLLKQSEEETVPAEETAGGTPEVSGEEESREHHHHHHHHHHHSSHSHHHRHHRSSRSGKSRKKRGKDLKKFWRQHKKILMPIAIVGMTVVVLVGVLLAVDLIVGLGLIKEPSVEQGTDGKVVLSVSVFHDEISLTNNGAKVLVENQDVTVAPHVILKNYDTEKSRLDVSSPVVIDFSLTDKPKDYTVERYEVEVSETNGFRDPIVEELGADQKSLALYNLKTGTQYYYRVNVYFTNGAYSSAGGAFRTAAGPRILTVGGIRNVRDIGGWKTADGKTVKQGLLYRGTEMDGANEPFKLTEDGKKVLRDVLKVKTDLDLRWPNEISQSVTPLGEGVQYISHGTPMYNEIFLDSGKESIRAIFSDLANPDNYPIYMHCIYGRDRTGTAVTVLLGLLGVSEDDLYREYRLTALHNKNLDSAFGVFMTQYKDLEGKDIQEKAELYLLSVGVTAEEIASIRSIFLG